MHSTELYSKNEFNSHCACASACAQKRYNGGSGFVLGGVYKWLRYTNPPISKQENLVLSYSTGQWPSWRLSHFPTPGTFIFTFCPLIMGLHGLSTSSQHCKCQLVGSFRRFHRGWWWRHRPFLSPGMSLPWCIQLVSGSHQSDGANMPDWRSRSLTLREIKACLSSWSFGWLGSYQWKWGPTTWQRP